MVFFRLKFRQNEILSFILFNYFLNHLFIINCFEDDDLDIIVSVNDGKSRIEAFKSKKMIFY